MKSSTRTRIQILLVVVLVISTISALLWLRRDRVYETPPATVETAYPTPTPSLASSPSPPSSATETPEVPQVELGLSATPATQVPQTDGSFVGQVNLIIPVSGVKPEQLIDTFGGARSEGRAHDAIDIPAAAGTPVVAAIDGKVARLFQSERGGTTIYQLSPDKKLVFYYAHLQRYADGIYAGKFVRQGEVIAYVGDTGNAGPGNFHLHFSIAALTDPKRYWEGTNINPYPLLRKP